MDPDPKFPRGQIACGLRPRGPSGPEGDVEKPAEKAKVSAALGTPIGGYRLFSPRQFSEGGERQVYPRVLFRIGVECQCP